MHWVHCGSKCSLFCVNFYLKKRGASGEPCGTLRKLSCPSQLSENCVLHLTAKLLTSTTIFSQTSICFSLALPWKSGEQVGANTSICKDWAQLSRNWHKCNGVKKKKKKKRLNRTTLSVNAAHSPVLAYNNLTRINACTRNYSTALYRRTSQSVCKLGACRTCAELQLRPTGSSHCQFIASRNMSISCEHNLRW